MVVAGVGATTRARDGAVGACGSLETLAEAKLADSVARTDVADATRALFSAGGTVVPVETLADVLAAASTVTTTLVADIVDLGGLALTGAVGAGGRVPAGASAIMLGAEAIGGAVVDTGRYLCGGAQAVAKQAPISCWVGAGSEVEAVRVRHGAAMTAYLEEQVS